MLSLPGNNGLWQIARTPSTNFCWTPKTYSVSVEVTSRKATPGILFWAARLELSKLILYYTSIESISPILSLKNSYGQWSMEINISRKNFNSTAKKEANFNVLHGQAAWIFFTISCWYKNPHSGLLNECCLSPDSSLLWHDCIFKLPIIARASYSNVLAVSVCITTPHTSFQGSWYYWQDN